MTSPVVGWSLLGQQAGRFLSSRFLSSGLSLSSGLALALAWGAPLPAQTGTDVCEELSAVGGDTSVSKAIQFNNPLTVVFGRTNFNTDFTVSNVYQSYWVNVQSDEPHEPLLDEDLDRNDAMAVDGSMEVEKDLFPLVSYLKFSDHTNLRIFGDKLLLEPGEYRRLGPFYPPRGKLVTEVNVKVGSNARPRAAGLRYTIAVDGCF